MINPLELIYEKARVVPRRIVLAEGEDPRIIEGASLAKDLRLARPILIGSPDRIYGIAKDGGFDLEGIEIVDLHNSDLIQTYAVAYGSLYRNQKEPRHYTEEACLAAVQKPLNFAAMMVRLNEADGSVAGAVATTSDTVRAALRLIGKAADAKIVSSFFLMVMDQPHHVKKGTFVFADCGMMIEPNEEELSEIAIASARSFEIFTGQMAKVAMLSFSTLGSASHPTISKINRATALVRDKAPDLVIDGELQFDAAFVPDVAASKAPNSSVAGAANVFVFPNLEAGNIGYKIAQRIGGAKAIGPILQGLARPANDLSRGCSAQDVCDCIAITAAQVVAQHT